MADDPETPDLDPSDDEVARARALILRRRGRFMAAAVASLGMLNTSCSKSSVCLSFAAPDAGASPDSGGPSVCLSPQEPDSGLPTACLGAGFEDGGPTVCLDIAIDAGQDALDAGQDAAADDAAVDGGADGGPDAGPTVCLSPPAEEPLDDPEAAARARGRA
jgi:hypothetical protein